MNETVKKTVILNNSRVMPSLGLGVWAIPNGAATERAVLWALEAGYRLIDTASIYGNEEGVGSAVRNSGLPRSEIFVTTKLWPMNFLRAESAFNESLERLGLDYVDLYLIHWPVPLGKNHAWKALEKIYEQGLAKAIGVSNFSINNLEALLQKALVVPAVNQVEFSPFSYKQKLLEYCVSKNIQLEAYSPLTRGRRLNDRRIAEVAQTYNKTPAQILIRWCLQHNAVVIPKSANRERIFENANVFDFEISEPDMAKLDALSEDNDGP